MSWSGSDEFYVAFDAEREPLYLLKWLASGDDVEVFAGEDNWAPAWGSALNEIHPVTSSSRDSAKVSEEEAESLKSSVKIPSAETLAKWAAQKDTAPSERITEDGPADETDGEGAAPKEGSPAPAKAGAVEALKKKVAPTAGGKPSAIEALKKKE